MQELINEIRKLIEYVVTKKTYKAVFIAVQFNYVKMREDVSE